MGSVALTLETDRYLSVSAKVEDEDIDWAEARKHGVSPEEIYVITYFSDIEYQTVMYMRDLLGTKAALEPDVMGFLSMWNYEEYYHGRVLARYLKECGHSLDRDRAARVRRSASLSELVESLGAKALSMVFSNEFPAVHAAWGAVQELTTLRGYTALAMHTRNPVLKVLADRIAKQERRHYAWYFNSARERLEASPRAQKLTRFLLSHFWSPVGAGVKTDAEVTKMMYFLFRPEGIPEMANGVDAKIGSLPGLEGISLMRSYMAKKAAPEWSRLDLNERLSLASCPPVLN